MTARKLHATDRHRTFAQKANIQSAVLVWWNGRRVAREHATNPLKVPLTVGESVRLTGLKSRGRHMRVTRLRSGSARCEWVHDGQVHADWFCVSGLRRAA